jgi:hypothetical protein
MGQGSITRKASDLRPLLLDRFRNAAAAYSLRPLTLSGQDNPVVKVRRSVDNTEQDFNPAQINDGTLEQFVNAGDVAPADYGTGAAAAYSLRHVSDGYTGDVVRVRRSVDNTEQDFNPTEIEDGTLASFVGGQNLLLRSEILGGGTGGASQTWTNFGTTYTANAINAPDGSLTADAMIETTDNSAHTIYLAGGTTVSAGQYTGSLYIKGGLGRDWVYLSLRNSGVDSNGAYFNLSTGSVGTVSAGVTASIQDAGNGWYRCIVTRALASSPEVYLDPTTATSDNGSLTFVGDVTKGIYVWGAQLEEGTTVGDYVPTSGTIAGDGHVTTWYDQSGNSNDATQATAASQPKIVSGGSLVTENGKPAIDFDGVDDELSFTPVTAKSAFLAFKLNSNSKTIQYVLGGDDGTAQGIYFGATISGYSSGAYIDPNRIDTGTEDTNQHLLSAFFTDTTDFVHLDNANSYSGDIGNSLVVSLIGSRPATNWEFRGLIQEIIVYSDDQSSNRELIETNVNHYYSIYSQTNDGFVTTWYDQSGNGNHATQSTAASQPKIVSAGSLVTRGGKASIQFDGTDDHFDTSQNNPFSFTGGVSIIHASYKNSTAYNLYETIISANGDGGNRERMAFGYINNISFASPVPSISTDVWAPLGIQYDGTVSTDSRHLIGYYISNWSTHLSTGLSNLRFNGADVATKPYGTGSFDRLGPNPIKIGVFRESLTTSFFAGEIQEIIAYADDRSSVRQQIESNINTHYGIY